MANPAYIPELVSGDSCLAFCWRDATVALYTGRNTYILLLLPLKYL
jgi:hypothetical protein